MTLDEAIDIIRQYECCKEHYEACEMAIKALKKPEIIFCKDCVKHNRQIGDIRDDGQLQYGNFYWKDEACPLVHYRGKSHGHEFDYQFCCCGERKDD